ncbi:Holliday junction resolvase RuvX [Oleiharenicola lentus]|jgi:putative Holliday junction resolvase|uniref:Putative pre-16S rRNA nuclease n=1 Tax=Oleiharenicola lentus TaxID=2508720 RepID=A0A4Q1CAD9_9BACT|nr:Holliday junction resolvase RuvX [Oleiharenicola lentus]RXK56057.1 Holliday junction resolvase RuvX [Oleiharenicola lentus]
MRCLGIDYGTKRVGLAQGDEIGVATPLPALTDADETVRWRKLGELIRLRRFTELVLGYPYNMDGTVGFKAKEVDAFAARLKAEFGLPVHLVDETLTSAEAESSIAKKNRRAVRDSGLIDSRAACLILQDYLDQKLPPAISGPQ